MQRCKMRLLQSGVSDNPREGNSISQGSDTQNFIPHIPLTCHSSRTPHRHSTKLGTHLSTPSPTPCPPAVHTNVCFSSSVPLGLSVWCWLSLAHWFYAALSMNSSNTSQERSRKGPLFLAGTDVRSPKTSPGPAKRSLQKRSTAVAQLRSALAIFLWTSVHSSMVMPASTFGGAASSLTGSSSRTGTDTNFRDWQNARRRSEGNHP